jgi:phage terminase large subunit-like protein
VAALGYAERAQLYARQVLAGEILACKWVKAACRRHLDDLVRAEQYDDPFPFVFDPARASRPCAFLECLPHVEGDWAKPVFVDGLPTYPKIRLEGWQVFFVAVLFGWAHRVTGLRRFRRAYLEVARKNAKSTLAAGLALYMLSADGEEGAQVWSAATKKDQAKIVWSIAQRMVQREPEFRQLAVRFNKKIIFQESTGSKYEPLGRDSDTQDGLSSSCFISDELHAQKDRGLYDVLDSSTGARSQALGLGITTAGTNTTGVCYEQRTYLARILNVTLRRNGGMGFRLEGSEHEDETYFGLIYTLDTGYADKRKDDDWGNPDVWIKANPNLGVSCLLDDMLAACTKAKASEQSQGEFRTKRCSQWIAAEAAWMDMAHWHACGEPDLKEDDFQRAECCVALDAAFKTDIFAKVKVFRRDEHYYAFGKYWVPQRQVEMKGNDHYAAWATKKLIEVADGAVVDVEPIKADLRRDAAIHTVREVPYDPAQLTQFSTEMLAEGFEMVEVRPTVMNFSEAMKKLGELVLEGKFHHNGDPVLAWMVGNVVFHRDHKDNIYPNKGAPAAKIDGVIALIMALARMTAAAEPASVYEERGVIVL